ncbi:MAG: hypothetical protein ACRD04_06340 [Terriglobales bacterium]
MCEQVRVRLDADALLGAEQEQHLTGCRECGEYAQLAAWSRQVLQAGNVEVAPPLMSSVWASIHRASEQAWDSALSRSFRYLLPYMVAVVALVALLGGLTAVHTPARVQAASAAYAVLSQPEPTSVASVMASVQQPAPDPSDLVRANSHR